MLEHRQERGWELETKDTHSAWPDNTWRLEAGGQHTTNPSGTTRHRPLARTTTTVGQRQLQQQQQAVLANNRNGPQCPCLHTGMSCSKATVQDAPRSHTSRQHSKGLYGNSAPSMHCCVQAFKIPRSSRIAMASPPPKPQECRAHASHMQQQERMPQVHAMLGSTQHRPG